MSLTSCLIWQTPAEQLPISRDGLDVDSARAGGRYFITSSAAATLSCWDEQQKVRLTSWLVEQRRLGTICPEIATTTLCDVTKRHLMSVSEREANLLRYLNAKSEHLGEVMKFYAMENNKAPEAVYELLAWTGSRKISELITLAEYCGEEGWIKYSATERSGSSMNTIHELQLRPSGYSRLNELDHMNSQSGQGFVAMWFDESMTDAYSHGILPAFNQAGYTPLRIDRKEHNGKIDDAIIAEIRRSRFVVADFTQGDDGPRGGVYYEAGFAHGLGIPVIFTCRRDAISKVHFDTRQYNHITWDIPSDLHSKLANRISATIGDGPFKMPS